MSEKLTSTPSINRLLPRNFINSCRVYLNPASYGPDSPLTGEVVPLDGDNLYIKTSRFSGGHNFLPLTDEEKSKFKPGQKVILICCDSL